MTAYAFRSIPHAGVEYAAAVDLRRRVLRLPLGLEFSSVELEQEDRDWHLVGYDARTGDLVAVLVLTKATGERVKMRQVAVEAAHRGQGVGKSLVAFAERFAVEHGFAEMVLHARDEAIAFYGSLDYVVEGEPFVEVSIVHRRMCKDLVN